MPICMELKDDCSEQVKYDHPDYPIYIHRGLLSDYPNNRAPNHWHNDLELISVISGKMNYNINGEAITLHSGEGVLINVKQMHFGVSDSGCKCDFICILLHPMLLCPTPSYEQDFVMPVIRNAAPYIKLASSTLWQKEILDYIHYMYSRKDSKTISLTVQSAFASIWGLLYDNISFTNESPAAHQNSDLSVIKNMVGFIQKNHTKKISLAEIASSGSVGLSKCCKLFASYFHQSPNAYLNHYRLSKSLELLTATDMNVLEIAICVGFNGASYYTECFKRWAGKSPTEYRKSCTAGEKT